MKQVNIPVRIFFLLLPCLLLPACELLSSEDEDKVCKDNKLSNPKDETLHYYMYLDKLDYYPDNQHVLFNAIYVEFQGTIVLNDCYELATDYHPFERKVYVKESITPEMTTYKCQVTPDLLFTFRNYREFLTIEYTILATFEDGSIYQSDLIRKTSDNYKYLNQQIKPVEIQLYCDSSINWIKLK